MTSAIRLLALLALVAAAAASCPNDCSGHGYCNQYSACNCYRNWMGADCSQRQCTWAHSFVDVPQGDLNADGRTDVPNIYKVTVCSANEIIASGGSPIRSFNTDQHTSDADQGVSDAKITIGQDASDAGWTAYILEDIYFEDQFTQYNDPHGVVEKCMERETTLVYAVVVHARADKDPGMICEPNSWRRDDEAMFFSDQSAGERFTRCDDKFDGTSTNPAANVPDLLRQIKLETGSTEHANGFVGDWSKMTYISQQTNDGLWEKYPDDHFHAGRKTGVDYFDRTSGNGFQPLTENDADRTSPVAYKKDDWDEGHFYAECSAKGLCDRSTGLCQCFPGFTGDGCARTACPNDCSGHGVCRRLVDQNDRYLAWDAYKTQTCDCDKGYSGPNCALRECPKGDDPITRLSTTNLQAYTNDGRMHTGHRLQTAEIQVIGVSDYSTLITGRGVDELKSTQTAPFALEYTDKFGDKWVTQTVNFRGGALNDCSTSFLGQACTNCVENNDCMAADGQGVCNAGGECIAGTATGQFDDWAADAEHGVGRAPEHRGRSQLDVAADIEAALEALPNNVIPNVEVNPQRIRLPQGCTVTDTSKVACSDYGAAIPNADWLNTYGGTSDVSANVAYTVTNGRMGTTCTDCTDGDFTFDNAGSASGPATRTNGLGRESLYAITFVENPGDVAMLGARYQWEFESDPTAAPVRNDCLQNIDTTAGADGDTAANGVAATTPVTVCSYSTNTAAGAFDAVTTDKSFYVDELFKGDKEEATCSNRGICDYSTGLCKCFTGFTTSDCSVQNALASA